MASLVLALSAMPCADKENDLNEAKTALTKTTHQEEDTHQDECSRFCHCTCCAGFSIDRTIASIILIPLFLNNPKSNFLPSNIIEVAFTFWQPPRSC
jgi:hypothetical protein